MSSIAASALRHLEKIIDKIKSGLSEFSRSPPRLLEYIMVKMVRAGTLFEERIVYWVKVFINRMSILQRSLARSVMLASLWIGLLFTLSLLLIAIMYSLR